MTTMQRLVISLTFVAIAVTASTLEKREDVLPTFDRVDCPTAINASACIKVEYGDNTDDLMLLHQNIDAPTVLTGSLESNSTTKVVVILRDQMTPNDTVVFKNNKTGGCTRFCADIDGDGETTCLNNAPLPPTNNTDDPKHSEPLETDRSLEERTLNPRALDPSGYKLNVVVHYDDMFNDEFGSLAVTRVQAIMAIVDEMYSESDTLQTTINVNLMATIHATGQNWGTVSWNSILSDTQLGQIAADSGHDANSYVFLTGSQSQDGLGLAWLGVVCHPTKNRRINVNKYAAGSQKGGDAYTAETIAHEMGHNLGMDHDCINSNCAYWDSSYVGPRQINGADCYGYMDYKDDTNYWSACSVSDFTAYINQQGTFCLETLVDNGGGDTTTPQTPDATTSQTPDATTQTPDATTPQTPDATTPQTPETTTPETTPKCVEVETMTTVWASEISWELGTCTNAEAYTDNKGFKQQCCLPNGDYVLECKDSYGDGWHGAYLEIDGEKYCNDFSTGSETTETITIVGASSDVTLDMKLRTKNWGVEISWTFGTCESAAEGTYGDHSIYTQQCTLAPGTYTLTCKDAYGDGWHGGYVEIQGTKYCKNFKSGSQQTEQVTVG